MSHSLLTTSVSLTVCLCLVIIFNVEEVETCGVSEFECNNGNCIVSSLRCDNNFDCLDSSDELNCDTQVNCPEGGTRCPDNTCAVNIAACSSQTTEETDTNNAENDQGCSTICLIGIILGVFLALFIIACIITIVFIKKRSNKHNKVDNMKGPCKGCVKEEDKTV